MKILEPLFKVLHQYFLSLKLLYYHVHLEVKPCCHNAMQCNCFEHNLLTTFLFADTSSKDFFSVLVSILLTKLAVQFFFTANNNIFLFCEPQNIIQDLFSGHDEPRRRLSEPSSKSLSTKKMISKVIDEEYKEDIFKWKIKTAEMVLEVSQCRDLCKISNERLKVISKCMVNAF